MADDVVSIDAVPYPILRVSGALQWTIESQGQEIEEVFTDWTGGLGVDVYYTDGIDTSTPNWLRLWPRTSTHTGGGSLAGIGDVCFWFEEMTIAGVKVLYFVCFQDAATDQMVTRKIRLDTVAWDADVNHFSGAFAAGRYGAGKPERFEKEWAVCWRNSTLGALFRVLQTVAEPGAADTWVSSDAGLFAGAFSQVQEEGTAKLARAYTTNLVAKAAGNPELAASWATGFEVGDDSVPISTMFEISGYLAVVKPDGIYLFDKQGFSYVAEMPLLRRRATSVPSSVQFGTVDNWDGIGSALWHKMILLVHETGAYLVNPLSGGLPVAVGPEALVGFWPREDVDLEATGIAPPRDGRPTWAATFGDYIFLTYNVAGAGSTILFGYPSKGASRAPFTWHEIGGSLSGNVRCLYIDTDQRLWFVDGNLLYYIQLTLGGHPANSLDTNRGVASKTSSVVLLKDSKPITFGKPGHQFQIRQVAAFVEGQATGTSVNLGFYLDNTNVAIAAVTGSTAEGLVEGEPAITALAYSVMPLVQIVTTSAYAPTTSDPRIRYVVIRARTPDLITCLIDMREEALRKYGLTPQQAWQNLSRLQNAGRKTIIEPGPVQTSYSGEVYATSRKQLSTQEGTFDVAEVKHRRWSVA